MIEIAKNHFPFVFKNGNIALTPRFFSIFHRDTVFELFFPIEPNFLIMSMPQESKIGFPKHDAVLLNDIVLVKMPRLTGFYSYRFAIS